VRLEGDVADVDDDVTQGVTLSKVADDGKGHV